MLPGRGTQCLCLTLPVPCPTPTVLSLWTQAAGDLLARAAAFGHAQSRLELALLKSSQVTDDDHGSVESLLRSAAEQGLPDAMVQLAAWLLRQRRESRLADPTAEELNSLRRTEAIAWLRKAAFEGCAEAQYRLALMLLGGPDGDPDKDWVSPLASIPRPADEDISSDALVLLKRAALHGHVAAQLRLGVALADSGEAWASCIALSRCAMSPAPSPHLAMAGLLLGRAYLAGTGVARSYARGVAHLQLVVQNNDSDAAVAAAAAELGQLRCSICGCTSTATCPDCEAKLSLEAMLSPGQRPAVHQAGHGVAIDCISLQLHIVERGGCLLIQA
jgi:TPR repeat protein